MLRNILLALARSGAMRKMVTAFPPAKRVARRFVAGEKVEDALAVVRTLQKQGLMVTLDLLGENVSRPEEATRAADEYIDVLNAVKANGLNSHISLKLTQMGLDQGTDVAYLNLCRVLEVAKAMNTFVRIDMEGSEYTERTIEVFRHARETYDNVGVVIQAYMRRSKSDVAVLNRLRGRMRLCKGAYSEPASVAYQERQQVTNNMKDLVQDALLNGDYPAIASHDEEVIQDALRVIREHKISNDRFEFQMLYGIRVQRQKELREQGYNVRIYVPFGKDWYPYFMRRLAERPANLVFFITALFRG